MKINLNKNLKKDMETLPELHDDKKTTDVWEEFKVNPAKSTLDSAKKLVKGQIDAAKFSELHTRQALDFQLKSERAEGKNNYSDKRIKQLIRRRVVDFKDIAPITSQLEVYSPFLNVLKNINNTYWEGFEIAKNFGFHSSDSTFTGKDGRYGNRFYENHWIRSVVGFGMAWGMLEGLTDYGFFGDKWAFCKRYYKPFDKANYLTMPPLICNGKDGQPFVRYLKIPMNSSVKITKVLSETFMKPFLKHVALSMSKPGDDPTRYDYLDQSGYDTAKTLSRELPQGGSGVINGILDIFSLANPGTNITNSMSGQNYIQQTLMTAAKGKHALDGEAGTELAIAKLKTIYDKYLNIIGYDVDINNEGPQSRNLNSLYIGDVGILAKIGGRFVTTSYDDQSVYAEAKDIKQGNAWEQFKKKDLTTKFITDSWDSFTEEQKQQFIMDFVVRTKNKQFEIAYRKKFGPIASRQITMMINAKTLEEKIMYARRANQTLRGITESHKDSAVIKNVIKENAKNKNKKKTEVKVRGRWD